MGKESGAFDHVGYFKLGPPLSAVSAPEKEPNIVAMSIDIVLNQTVIKPFIVILSLVHSTYVTSLKVRINLRH